MSIIACFPKYLSGNTTESNTVSDNQNSTSDNDDTENDSDTE